METWIVVRMAPESVPRFEQKSVQAYDILQAMNATYWPHDEIIKVELQPKKIDFYE